MARYFFNVDDGQKRSDLMGTELPDIEAARQHAVMYFGDLLRFSPCEFWHSEKWKMDVINEDDLIVFSLLFVAVSAPVVISPLASASLRF